jgi:hypothetical protein
MEQYWEKRHELPTECVTTTEDSSNEEEDTDDNDLGFASGRDEGSSMAASSPPASLFHDSKNDDKTPDISFAKYRAQKAALSQKSGYSGWRAELRG